MCIAKGWLIAGFLFVGGLLCLWGFGCDDKSTDPNDQRPHGPKDYVFYWSRYGADGADSTFFGYHTLTAEIDSFHVPGTRIYDLNVSADGQRVYISYSDKTKVVRAKDFAALIDLPYSGWYGVAVSPDNRHIAVQSGNLRILSTVDYSVVFEDTIGVYRSVFSANGRCLYAPGPTSPCRSVYRLDLADGFKSTAICVPDSYGIARVVPSIDERFLFMFRTLGNCYSYFDVYDVAGDSLVFRDLVAPACGDLVVSPDNQFVYFTGPGDLHGWPPSAYTFARYSLNNAKIDSMLYFSMCGFDVLTGIGGDNIAITPDGRRLAVGEFRGLNRLVLYDCHACDTVAVKCLIGAGFYYVKCQNAQ